jgi:TolB-like protein
VAREHCRRELTFAMAESRTILPVQLVRTELPPALHLMLSNRQAILRHEHSRDAYRSKLGQALRDAIGSRPAGGTTSAEASRSTRRSRAAIWMGALTLLVVLLAVLWRYGPAPEPPVTTATTDPVELGRAITAIAVSSFEDASPGTTIDWLAPALAAHLRNELAQVEGLSVVPVGVPESAVLRGTLQVLGNTVVVFMELVDSGSGLTLWAQDFQGTADDPMEMQERVLLQIVRSLERRFVAESSRLPRSQAAQIAWLRALADGYGGETVNQRYWLERVLAEDPQFAPAHLAVFWPYVQHARAYAHPVWVEKAGEALDHAEELGLGERWDWHFAKGAYLWQFAGAFGEAETYLRRSLIAGGSGHQYAQWMLASGLVAEARDYLEQAVVAWRYLPVAWLFLSDARALSGDVEGAYEAALQATKLLPPDAITGRYALMWALPRLGRLEEAERELVTLRNAYQRMQRYPDLRLISLSLEFDIAFANGEHERAAELAATLESEGWHQIAGFLFLVLDDDRATRALEAGAQPPFYRVNHLPSYLRYLSPAQRQDPRIRRMLDAMGFTSEWRLEFCHRISTLPRESGLACDPRRYETGEPPTT